MPKPTPPSEPPQLEQIPVDKLINYAKNARTHSPAQIDQIAASIKEFGFNAPILIDGENVIIAGHGRLQAAKKLELAVVPCLRLTHMSDAQRRAYILADNRIAMNAGFDEEMLKLELAQLQIDEVDLGLLGFDMKELEALDLGNTENPDLDAEPQIDKAEELREKWQTETGQMWQLGEHRLLCGDSTKAEDVERVMGGEKADVLSDPPYGISVVSHNKVGGGGPVKFGKIGGGKIVDSRSYAPVRGDETTDAAKEFYLRCVESGLFGNFILWGGNYFTDFLPPSRAWIIWDKENTGNFADAELAWTSFDKSVRLYRWLWNGMSRKGDKATEGKSRFHPTQKPVGLHVEIIREWTTGIIFDGFLGSGTTLIACEQLNRKCRAIEISPAYVAVTLQRWADATGKEPKLL